MTLEESPLKQKVERQIQDVTQIIGQGYQTVGRDISMAGREVDEAYRTEEKAYYDNLWKTHYADKHDGS